MSPEERQLLTGLFDRIRASANTTRDPEAEALIANAVKAQPYAPYFLAQAVIVQNQALEAANQKLNELQAQLESQQPQGQPAGGGFLSSLGSIFGGPSAPPEPPRPQQPLPGGPWGQIRRRRRHGPTRRSRLIRRKRPGALRQSAAVAADS